MNEPNNHHTAANPELKSAKDSYVKDTSIFQLEQSALNRYSNLSWELRHHIHTFCVQGSYDNEVIVRRGTDDGPTLLVRQSSGPHSYQWITDPFFQQLAPNRIGLSSAREMLGVYYRTRIFKFTQNEFDALRPFLETRSSLGIRTADHVRQLHLQILPFVYAQLRERDAKDRQERTCREALKSLLVIQSPSTTINLHADLSQGFCDDEEYNELLGAAAGFVFRIVGLVGTLRRQGLKVEVTLAYRWNGKDGTNISSSSLHSPEDFVSVLNVICR